MILNDNLGLNLCVVSTVCCMVIISDDEVLERSEMLVFYSRSCNLSVDKPLT